MLTAGVLGPKNTVCFPDLTNPLICSKCVRESVFHSENARRGRTFVSRDSQCKYSMYGRCYIAMTGATG